MSTNHNRIRVADLETNQQNKILTTNSAGELEFTDINTIQIDSYNALDYTSEGKALDARQGKILKNLIDNIYDWATSKFKTWLLDINTQTGTSYTLSVNDHKSRIVFTNSNPVALTIPLNSSIPIPIGAKIEFTQKGLGRVNVNSPSVSLYSNIPPISVYGETRILTKIGIDEWAIEGSNDVSTKQDITNQIEIGSSQNAQTSWHGKTVLFTANCTITIPSSIIDGFIFNGITLPGVTITWVIQSPHTWLFGAPSTTTEKQIFTLTKRGSTNSILLLGA